MMEITTEQSVAVTNWLRDERKRRGLTVQQVAERTGVHRSRISDLEKSFTANTRFIDIARLARLYEVDLNEIARRLGM